MKKISLLLLLMGLILSGCCNPKYIAGYISGNYVSQPFGKTGASYSKTVKCAYDECYDKVEKTLLDLKSYIYSRSKGHGYISAMSFNNVYTRCINTTEVGIYLEKKDNQETQITVACGNYGLGKFVADKLFEKFN